MKVETKGRQFSKRTTWTIESIEDLERLFREQGTPDDQGRRTVGADFVGAAQGIADKAAAFLRSRDLPDTSWIHWPKSAPHTWRPGKGDPDDFKAGCSVEHYVLKHRGYQHDKPEGLAARILTACSIIDSSDGDARLLSIFNLGYLVALWNVYAALDPTLNEGRKRGAETNRTRADQRRSQIAQANDDLKEKRPDMTKTARARHIRERIPRPDGKAYSLRRIMELID